LQLIAQQTQDAYNNMVDSQTFTYDAYGYQASQTNGAGGPSPRTTTSTNDANGQLLSQTNPAGDTTQSAYSAAGLQTVSIDARGVETDTHYNTAGQVTQEIGDENQSVQETTQDGYDSA